MKEEGSAHTSSVLVVGTGAMATLFAARLAQAGHRVTMLGSWANGLRGLRQNGARLARPDGSIQQSSVSVADDPAACRGTQYALVLVKSWQTNQAAQQLATCLAKDGVALTLQNGLGNRELLAAALGAQRVVLGSTTTGATLLGPGLAMAGGEGVVSLEAHERAETLRQILESAGFSTEIVADARALIWNKLIINSAINPLTALLRVPNGQLLSKPSARLMMRALANETAAVAAAERVQLPRGDPGELAEKVARQTAQNHSSMFQDIQRGAPTEVDAICGAVTREGEKHGVPTPMNRACWYLIQALTETVVHDGFR